MTVRSWNTNRSDGIIAIPARTFDRELDFVVSLPSNMIFPPIVGLMPMIVRIVVLLPLPL